MELSGLLRRSTTIESAAYVECRRLGLVRVHDGAALKILTTGIGVMILKHQRHEMWQVRERTEAGDLHPQCVVSFGGDRQLQNRIRFVTALARLRNRVLKKRNQYADRDGLNLSGNPPVALR